MSTFINMHGHGIYVFSAYGIVLVTLAIQWIVPWRRLKKQTQDHE